MFYNFRHSSRNGRFILCAAAFLCLFLTACEEGQQQHGAMPSVSYMVVTTRPFALQTELPGRTSSFMSAEVRPQVGGIIQERLFEEGSYVKKGDVLYQIDPSLFQATYNSAAASLEKAEANAEAARLLSERYQKIVRVNAVSKQEYDNAVAAYGQAQAEISSAKAALDTARINLEYTKVTAPISGHIGRSSVTPGALVTQNQASPLAIIQQLDPMYVDVTQSSSEMLRLKRAIDRGDLTRPGDAKGKLKTTLVLEDGTRFQTLRLKTDPETGQPFYDKKTGQQVMEMQDVEGEIQFSEVTVEQSTGAVTIRAIFPNPDGILLPGMYVRAVVEEGVNERAILIPQKTVIRNNRGIPVVQVLVKDDKNSDQESVYRLEARPITVDRSFDNQWLVTSGLNEGELVLTEGLMRIQPNMEVRGELDPNYAQNNASTGSSPRDNANAPTTDEHQAEETR